MTFFRSGAMAATFPGEDARCPPGPTKFGALGVGAAPLAVSVVVIDADPKMAPPLASGAPCSAPCPGDADRPRDVIRPRVVV